MPDGRFVYLNVPAGFAGKDPNGPELQALRDQLAEKRRKREEKVKGKVKGQKGEKANARHRGDKRSKPEHRGQTGHPEPTTDSARIFFQFLLAFPVNSAIVFLLQKHP